MTIEDIVNALYHTLSYDYSTVPWAYPLGTAPKTYAFLGATQWDKDFVKSIHLHTIMSKPLSTKQDRILRRLAARYTSDISEVLASSETQVQQALEKPTYRKPLYQSRDIKREVRFVSGSEIALRFKKNATVLSDLQKLILISQPLKRSLRWSREGSVWLLTVDSFNVDEVCDLLGRYNFDVDDSSLKLFEALQPSTENPISIDFDEASKAFSSRHGNSAIFSWWMQNNIGDVDSENAQVATPAFVRKLKRIASILPVETSSSFDALADQELVDEQAIARLPASFTPFEVGAIQKLLDQDLRAVLPVGSDPRARSVTLAAIAIRTTPLITVCTNQATMWMLLARQFGYVPKLNDLDVRHPFVIVTPDGDATISEIAARRAGVLITDVSAGNMQRAAASPYALLDMFPYLEASKDFAEVIMLCNTVGLSMIMNSTIGGSLPTKLDRYLKAFHYDGAPKLFSNKNEEHEEIIKLSLEMSDFKLLPIRAYMPLYGVITDFSS